MSNALLRPVGIGLIGCGRIAASHLAAVAAQPELARLVAVADRDPAAAARVASQYPGVQTAADATSLCSLSEVEAVIITSPNELHCEHALTALAHGRHVLVEKPMAGSLADAKRMGEAARASERVLAIAQSFRHGPAVRYVDEHRSEFGNLRALEVTQCVLWDGPPAAWWSERSAAQGTILPQFAPHALDFVQLIMRDDPIRVHIEAARHQQGWRGEDEVMIVLAFPGRRMAQIHLSYNQRPTVGRHTLFFDRGVLRLEDGETVYWNDELLFRPEGTTGDRWQLGSKDLLSNFREQVAQFTRAVRGLENRSVLYPDGVRLMTVLDRLLTQAREQCSEAID